MIYEDVLNIGSRPSMIEIRNFTGSDKQDLAKIYLNSRLDTFRWVPNEQFKIEDFDRDTEGEVILVATLNLVPIGFVSIWMQDNFIHHLFIDPAHQRLGVGQALLAAAMKIMKRPARLKCVVQNSRACTFYEKNGWKIESTTNDKSVMGPYHTYIFD